MIRPEARAALMRWREVAAAAGLGLFGGWLIALGGFLLVPVGAGAVALALGWGVNALRRMRFDGGGSAPGMVEVDEGQVGYFGPSSGGFLSLADLVEIRLIGAKGAQGWRLRDASGQVLLIPVAAEGAQSLFDAFSTLPGIDLGALSAALARPGGGAVLWHRAVALEGEGARGPAETSEMASITKLHGRRADPWS